VSFKAIQSQKLIRSAKTNAQKKWAVKTRPFGREARIVAPLMPACNQNTCRVSLIETPEAVCRGVAAR
jgi:hypothetical protein